MAMPSPVTLAKDDAWLAEQLRSEALSSEPIVVPPSLTKPSYALITTINAVKAAKADKSSRLKADRDSTFTYPPHFRFHPSVMALRVTPASADRALLIIDTLMKACARRGLEVSVANRYMRVTHGDHEVQVRMSERVEQIVGSTKGMSSSDVLFKRHVRYRPTGEFTVAVIRMGVERKTIDKNGARVEDQLGAVLANIYRGIAERRIWSAYLEASAADAKKRAEVRNAERAEREALEAEAERIAEDHRQRQLDVVAEATAWTQSKAILAYVDHLVGAATKNGGPMTVELRDWIGQATTIAEHMDPTRERIANAPKPEVGPDGDNPDTNRTL